MKTGRLEARDIMTRTVRTARPTDPIRKVIDTICRHKVSGVPVVDGKGQLAGLVSERDILYAIHRGTAQSSGKPSGRKETKGLRTIDELLARDVMVVKVITGTPDTDALRLASVMALRKIRRIPIVEGRTLVGIVSHGDVYRAIFGVKGGSRCSRRRL
ncbi:MAG: CBS domain-containing protein [Deltaproteobacteria bacterium]|nr:CBS domain-containing protein [Deltaproteobacteria bacterium]